MALAYSTTAKVCPGCHEAKPLSAFPSRSDKPDQVRRYCRPCYNARYNNRTPEQRHQDYEKQKAKGDLAEKMRDYRARNPEYFREYRKQYRFKQHGITEAVYNEMLERQGGGCAVCGEQTDLHIDHDHKCCTGTYGCSKCVRGLLCPPCNTLLAVARDDASLLLKAAEYLERGK